MTLNILAITASPESPKTRRVGAGIACVCALFLMANGCGEVQSSSSGSSDPVSMGTAYGGPAGTMRGGLMTIPADWESFNHHVLKSSRPVLIELSKNPCPPCDRQKEELEKLTDEFGGQVTFVTLTLVEGEFNIRVPEIRERYKILWLPTTILFVDGKEWMRWENLHKAPGIREELKQALLQRPAGQ